MASKSKKTMKDLNEEVELHKLLLSDYSKK